MIEYKQSVQSKVPVRISDSGGLPISGLSYSAVSAAVLKSNGTVQTLTVTNSDWSEVTTGAFSGQGVYWLLIPASALDTTGFLSYAVTPTSGSYKSFIGTGKVVANEEVDTYTRVGAPAFTTIAGDIANVTTNLATTNSTVNTINTNVNTANTSLSAITTTVNTINTNVNTANTNINTTNSTLSTLSTVITRIQLLKEGRWKLFTTGPDANRIVLYAADGTTVLQKWDLFDSAGAPSSSELFERVPVLAIP